MLPAFRRRSRSSIVSFTCSRPMATSDDIRRMSDELARDPGSRVFVPLGDVLRRQGQYDIALKMALKGLERHPHLVEGHDLLARLYVDRGEFEKGFDEWDMCSDFRRDTSAP